jgi:prephenate dehydrogenase
LAHALEHLAIIGVGLIGGSVARSLRAAGHVGRITGIGRDAGHLEKGRVLGVVDDCTTDIAAGVADADAVLVSVPMGAYDAVFSTLAGALPAHAVLTDAGSTKQHAIDAARRHLGQGELARFVPAHPIAGTEHSGVEASLAGLFRGRLCVLTPLPENTPESVSAVGAMWQATGAEVLTMGAAEHDDFLAAVSHLPHLLAFALVDAVRKMGDAEHDPFRFAAGGFRDFTRIASSSPVMWRDIALANRRALLAKLSELEGELAALRTAIEAGDGQGLLDVFEAAKSARDRWLAGHGGSL